MCMKCGCSIPNDKKSTKMVLPSGKKAKTEMKYHGKPKSVYGKRVRNNA